MPVDALLVAVFVVTIFILLRVILRGRTSAVGNNVQCMCFDDANTVARRGTARE